MKKTMLEIDKFADAATAYALDNSKREGWTDEAFFENARNVIKHCMTKVAFLAYEEGVNSTNRIGVTDLVEIFDKLNINIKLDEIN